MRSYRGTSKYGMGKITNKDQNFQLFDIFTKHFKSKIVGIATVDSWPKLALP